MGVTRYRCDFAHLGAERAAADVVVSVEDGTIVAVEPAGPGDGDARRLRGLTIPGFANAHSHAFHRALRGRAERPGTFWDWRARMYAVAEALDPERYRRLARAVYGEMALAGITAVGEFHYLHHPPGGGRYADPNEMAEALADAAADAGVRLTLLDTCYLESAPGAGPRGVQGRFSDGDVAGWLDRVEALARRWGAPLRAAPPVPGAPAGGPDPALGAAVHSLRAVPPGAAAEVAAWAAAREAPLHVHLSEQPAENEAVRAAYGASPAAVLAAAGALGPRATAVHATHLADGDAATLGRAGTGVCLCPTTERALADGIGPAGALVEAGCPLSLGTDSHAVIDPFEEARGLEMDERLATGRRGTFGPAALLDAATAGGQHALGREDAGRIAPGRRADLVTISLEGPRLAGVDGDCVLEYAAFAATAADVTDVLVGGKVVVADGRHTRIDVAAELRAALSELVGGAR